MLYFIDWVLVQERITFLRPKNVKEWDNSEVLLMLLKTLK